MNPLLHFVRSGAKEGRNPHPLFDTLRYKQLYPETADPDGSPLVQYLERGGADGREPHVLFDGKWYLERNPNVAAAGINPLVHYLQRGWRERRDPHPLFHGEFYLEQNPDVDKAGINPLVHFAEGGFKEGRNPNPLFDLVFYSKKYADVLSTGVNPLIHYVLSGAFEQRQTHPLFDPLYYLARGPIAAAFGSPLAHYFEEGIKQFRSPHPLFDFESYFAQQPQLEETGIDPLAHYVEIGAALGFDPCALFDTSYYLDQYSETRESGQNPLVHYLLQGAQKGYNPNPLFDTAYYMKKYPDVVASGENPLVHYIESGAFERRSPSPFFDSHFYLRKNPGLRSARINPLAHFLRHGGVEGRDPSPFFSSSDYLSEHPEVREKGINPLVHFLESSAVQASEHNETASFPPILPAITLRCTSIPPLPGSKPLTTSRNLVICVTHVSPYPPRAGNEYRIDRLLKWLRSEGYRVLPIVSPLPGQDIANSQISHLAKEFGGAIACRRDGSVLYCLYDDHEARIVSGEDGVTVPAFAERLAENTALNPRELYLLDIDRTFCHDALLHLVTKLAGTQRSCMVLAEYIFMSRVFPLLGPGVLKAIDTHDVFSSKKEKVVAFGVSDTLSMSKEEESERLSRADLVIAIQPEEQMQLAQLVRASKVVSAGVDFPVSQRVKPSAEPILLYPASDSAMNVRGLLDFVRFVWPSILQSVPKAEFLVAGKVGNALKSPHPRVRVLGLVDDIDELYAHARVVINPALAGTGLKIKTLESLSHFRPIVTWPTGTDGMHPSLAMMCCVAKDWFEFGAQIISVLAAERNDWFSDNDRRTIEELLSPESAYSTLGQRLSEYFQTELTPVDAPRS